MTYYRNEKWSKYNGITDLVNEKKCKINYFKKVKKYIKTSTDVFIAMKGPAAAGVPIEHTYASPPRLDIHCIWYLYGYSIMVSIIGWEVFFQKLRKIHKKNKFICWIWVDP